jgi:hypothetical protein
MKKLGIIALIVCAFALAVSAQMRPVDKESSMAGIKIKPAPESFQAKYEGGLFGFSEKESGTLRFDDANERIVFFNKEGKELFGIPYTTLLVVSPQSQTVTSTTGTVVQHVPLPGAGLASLLKEKKRYLVLQFNDPDADARGTVNFKVDNKELLESVIDTLGMKAKLTPRGDSYYRPKAKTS